VFSDLSLLARSYGDSTAVASMEDAIEQAAEAQLCPIGISFYID
jgi:hypothetical protein